MAVKHTPFPWVAAEDRSVVYSTGSTPCHQGVAALGPDPFQGGSFAPPDSAAERAANAQLIGAMESFVRLARLARIHSVRPAEVEMMATRALTEAGLLP